MKMIFTTPLLVLLFLAFLMKANGQQDSTAVVTRDSLFYRSPFFSLYPKLFNNDKQLSHEATIQLLAKEPAALADYKKYRNKQKVGLYSVLGVFGFLGAGTYFLGKGNRGATGVSLTLSVYSFINSIVFLSLADGKLRKVIKQYNQSSLRY